MPLPTCDAGHDWSSTYVERLRGANNVLIVRLMQECLACKKTREVFPQEPASLEETIKKFKEMRDTDYGVAVKTHEVFLPDLGEVMPHEPEPEAPGPDAPPARGGALPSSRQAGV